LRRGDIVIENKTGFIYLQKKDSSALCRNNNLLFVNRYAQKFRVFFFFGRIRDPGAGSCQQGGGNKQALEGCLIDFSYALARKI